MMKHTPQVDPTHYAGSQYESKERLVSYWHQIDEIRKVEPTSLLEIGIGSGFLSRYLREQGLSVTTMDFDERLNPDVVGSVQEIPFEENAFDVVACFEVLEHIPYEDVPRALEELFRVTARHAIISVPDSRTIYRIDAVLPLFGHIRFSIPKPVVRPGRHEFDGEHYWEVNKAGYELRQVIAEMQAAGFVLRETYRIFEFPYHRFFVLEKRD